MASSQAAEPRSRYPFIIAGIVLSGAVLIISTGFSGGRYSLEIAAVAEDREAYVGHDLKVVGKIKEGSSSTKTVDGRVELHFTVQDADGHELKVIYPHNPPDPFKEGRECIVEGEMQPGGDTILCSKLTVKCPSKYQNEDGSAGGGESMEYYQDKYGGGAAGAPPSPTSPSAGGR